MAAITICSDFGAPEKKSDTVSIVSPSIFHEVMGPDAMKVKEESDNVGLKLNIQKTKIMASGPITSWKIDGETMETVSDFFSGAPKSLQMVIAAMKLKDVCSLEEKLWPTWIAY